MASYDTMAAYLERENNRLAEEDRAVSKRIADEAIAKVMGTQNQINTNIDNAIETAYRQRESAPVVAETSKIANNALTDRIVRGYGINRDTIRRNLDNLKAGIKVNQEQNNLKTDKNYDTSDESLELALARREADNARIEAQETARQQEGFLEQLNEISKQAGYDYDFDADIFALKQQGYTDKDWQIQYLQEAKRLQKRNAKTAKNSGSATNEDTFVPAPSYVPDEYKRGAYGGAVGDAYLNEQAAISQQNAEEISKTQQENYTRMANGISQYRDISSNPDLRRTIEDNILDANESGAISDEQAIALLQASGLI